LPPNINDSILKAPIDQDAYTIPTWCWPVYQSLLTFVSTNPMIYKIIGHLFSNNFSKYIYFTLH
jgi:hypothetical protein